MKRIPLTRGYEAIVDDADYDWLMQWKWCYNNGYAVRHQQISGSGKNRVQKRVYMHRAIMASNDGWQVDHINNNRLDNQRANLRQCSLAENVRRVGCNSKNTSGFKGVFWEAARLTWRARIRVNGLRINLGSFATRYDAAIAYNKAAIRYHGTFAYQNQV